MSGPFTKGFNSPAQLLDHFQSHGGDFGAKDAEDYQRMADEFLGGVIASHVLECTRSGVRKGDVVRFDTVNGGVWSHEIQRHDQDVL